MFDFLQGFFYHVTLSQSIPLSEAWARWAVLLSRALLEPGGTLRVPGGTTAAWEMTQGREWPGGRDCWDPCRVAEQESGCSLGLACWGMWFFRTCLWAQARAFSHAREGSCIKPAPVLCHLGWSSEEKDQDVPGVWGVRGNAASRRQQQGCLQPVPVMMRWALWMPCLGHSRCPGQPPQPRVLLPRIWHHGVHLHGLLGVWRCPQAWANANEVGCLLL